MMNDDPWAEIRMLAGPELPTLIAVAEVPSHDAPWRTLDAPTAHTIRLGSGLTLPQIGTLVASSAIDGSWQGQSPNALLTESLEQDSAVLMGGVFSLGVDRSVIHPGCCVGLEDWRQWVDAEASGDNPQFGHGPPEAWMKFGPKVIAIEQGDWTRNKEPQVLQRVMFTRDEYRRATSRLASDIDAFALQVLEWATALSPELGSRWAEHWLRNLDMLPGTVRDR